MLEEIDCAGETPIIVASDLAAQSDIYSAVTLAGVLGTDCIIDAEARTAGIENEQLARLAASDAAAGYVVGGVAAVPDGKHDSIAGMTRNGDRRLAGLSLYESDGSSCGYEGELASEITLYIVVRSHCVPAKAEIDVQPQATWTLAVSD